MKPQLLMAPSRKWGRCVTVTSTGSGWGPGWGQLWHQDPRLRPLKVYNLHIGYPDADSLVAGA